MRRLPLILRRGRRGIQGDKGDKGDAGPLSAADEVRVSDLEAFHARLESINTIVRQSDYVIANHHLSQTLNDIPDGSADTSNRVVRYNIVLDRTVVTGQFYYLINAFGFSRDEANSIIDVVFTGWRHNSFGLIKTSEFDRVQSGKLMGANLRTNGDTVLWFECANRATGFKVKGQRIGNTAHGRLGLDELPIVITEAGVELT